MWRRAVAFVVDFSTLLGVFILATGGYWHHAHGGPEPEIDLTYYGPFFAPLVLCLLTGFRPGGRALPLLERARAALDGAPARVQGWFVGLTLAALSLAHCVIVYLRYQAFVAGMDLAIYANACRNDLFSTMKGDVWLLADHFEPLLLVFSPLCHVFDPAVVLLVVQEFAFGVGAAGLYALARRCDYSPALAWLVAASYLGFSGNVTAAHYDFHLLALALGLVPWLWWALFTERYWIVAVLSLLYVGLKESTPLSLIGLGGFLLLRGPQRRRVAGACLVVFGAASFLLIMKVVYPLFRHGEGTMYFAKYYGHLGRDMGEVLHTIVTRPLYFLSTLATPPKLMYLAAVFAPFLFLPVVRPIYLLPVAPALLVNVMSNDGLLIARAHHYEADVYPCLFAMATVALANPRLRGVWLALLLVVFAAPSPSAMARRMRPNEVQRRLVADLRAHVPKDVAVAAPQRLAAHLTRIPRLYMFDYWQMEDDWRRADIVVVGYPRNALGWYTWSVLQYLKLPRMQPLLELVYQDPEDPRFRIFKVRHPRGIAQAP